MSVQSNKSHEPSMEEVLASIRRIISEEMENPSRSNAPQSDGQHFEFPWSQSSSQSSAAPASQPKLPQSAAMRHPFMPAPKTVAVEPVAADDPAPRGPVTQSSATQNSVNQPSLSNADFLSAYFADIAEKNAVRGVVEPASAPFAEATLPLLGQPQVVTPVIPVQAAPLEAKPVQAPPAADYPFAGIIPLKKLETSTTIQMVPVPVAQEPVINAPVQGSPIPEAAVTQTGEPVSSSQMAEPARPSPVHVADAMMAAFIQANLLPAKPEASPASVSENPVVDQPAVEQVLAVETTVVTDGEAPSGSVVADQPEVEAVQTAEATETDNTGSQIQGLMSDRTAHVFAASLSSLTQSVKTGNHNGPYPRLDEFVAELMKPLVSDWMDQHLERIVEEAVRDEIKRVSKLARS